MKNNNFDKKYVQVAMLSFIVIVGAIIFGVALWNIEIVMKKLSIIKNSALNILSPFFVGFCIAYLLNPGVRETEKLFQKMFSIKKEKVYRGLSILLVYFIAFIFFAILVTSIVPSVAYSIEEIVTKLPKNLELLQQEINTFLNNNMVAIGSLTDFINNISPSSFTFNDLATYILAPINNVLLNIPEIASKIIVGTINLASIFFKFILGIVISVYMIYDKEHFSNVLKRILFTFTKEKVASKTMKLARLSNSKFERFIVGKTIDSIIIGTLFYVACKLLSIEYAMLLALIIAITNMIPYFGPFIGAVPVTLIVALTNLSDVVPVIILIIILQQFDGIILGPKILGDSVGLKPISIILAILVGGGLFGAVGMFLGAPILAIITTIISGIMDIKERGNSVEKNKV
ncbi:MAG: AI-2E family transporter [Lachnospirales bacterium]